MKQEMPPVNNEPQDVPVYFEKRKKLYPRVVIGFFRRLKWGVLAFALGLYYLVPFLRWDRGENSPDQAVLIDLSRSRAYFFGIEIWPQEVYYIAAFLVFAAIGLFFVTNLFGRIWCGYLCPQTVWTDLFVKIETLVQGDRGARKRLDEGSWTFEKIWKKGLTHFLWLVVSALTGGAFVFYFNDSYMLLNDLLSFSVSSNVLFFIGGLTVSTYVMAGFSREQVCIYMCPYSRFQSAMFDRDTLIIAYDASRGEPRGVQNKNSMGLDKRGDCIDCSACVQVCPVGIDIREGLQIECIACGLCIDACDDVMDKVGLPRGLIRYDSERNMNEEGARSNLIKRFFRPSVCYYGAVLLMIMTFVLYSFFTRLPFDLHVLHDRNPLFVRLSDGKIRNGYDIRILNKSSKHKNFRVETEGVESPHLVFQNVRENQKGTIDIDPGSIGRFRVFLSAPVQKKNQVSFRFIMYDPETGLKIKRDSVFVSGRK